MATIVAVKSRDNRRRTTALKRKTYMADDHTIYGFVRQRIDRMLSGKKQCSGIYSI
jgi:hypothetical protein